jgi:hypothetical protein
MLLRRPVPHSRLLRTVLVATVLAVAVGAVVVRTIAALPGARAAEVSPPGRPPGLVQAGDSKTTCVFAGSGAWKSSLQAVNVATAWTSNASRSEGYVRSRLMQRAWSPTPVQ